MAAVVRMTVIRFRRMLDRGRESANEPQHAPASWDTQARNSSRLVHVDPDLIMPS
jgi:hypothetical protein